MHTVLLHSSSSTCPLQVSGQLTEIKDVHKSYIMQWDCRERGSHRTPSACCKAVFIHICKQYCQLCVPEGCKQEVQRRLRWRMLNHEHICLNYYVIVLGFGSMLLLFTTIYHLHDSSIWTTMLLFLGLGACSLLFYMFFNLNFALSPLCMHHVYSTC